MEVRKISSVRHVEFRRFVGSIPCYHSGRVTVKSKTLYEPDSGRHATAKHTLRRGDQYQRNLLVNPVLISVASL